eukprot:TRINITY_DN17199_c0_g1_i1.p1 TRINITY_DN17199_c0_g1~~TRINITY_DN17199_c0_g1_i1.p1  ORF type:complete len:427 (+),score=49.75 TRINITY_DN17199_c0_g1_i1:113-1393(+)
MALKWLRDGLGCMFYCLPPRKLALAEGDEVPNLMSSHGTAMFFLMIGVECCCGHLLGPKGGVYRLNDLLSSVSSGTSQQLFLELVKLIADPKHLYAWINSKCGWSFDVKTYPLTAWLCLLLGYDLSYYWAHRCLHVVHAGWASHSVHHTGEDYNLATALRQGALQPLMTCWFSLPLALVFPAESITVHSQLNTLFQFWIHTELCGRLGLLEYVLNTPFHHRMHHRPPGNCNYAGVLIVWDRLFGTHAAETERLDYFGLARPVSTFDPIELNLQHWRKVMRMRISPPVWFPSFLQRAFTARAHHQFKLQPGQLLEPFQPISGGRSSWHLPKEPKRPKYDGAVLGFSDKLVCLAAFGGGFAALQRCGDSSLSSGQKLFTAAAGLASLGALGSYLDTGAIDAAFMTKLALSFCCMAGSYVPSKDNMGGS